MSLIKWTGDDLLPSFSSMVEDFFGKDPFDSMLKRVSKMGTSMPAVNLKETDESYNLEVATPGLEKEDINLKLENNVLTISSEKKAEKEEEDKGYKRREFSFSSFSRSFNLPENVDQEKINASYKDGVLSLLLPKREVKETEKSRKIDIS